MATYPSQLAPGSACQVPKGLALLLCGANPLTWKVCGKSGDEHRWYVGMKCMVSIPDHRNMNMFGGKPKYAFFGGKRYIYIYIWKYMHGEITCSYPQDPWLHGTQQRLDVRFSGWTWQPHAFVSNWCRVKSELLQASHREQKSDIHVYGVAPKVNSNHMMARRMVLPKASCKRQWWTL